MRVLNSRYLMVVIVTAVTAIVWFGESQVKPLDGDAVCFIPTATSLAAGHGWANQLYRPAEVADPAHPQKFTWHGVMAPMLWSSLSPSPSYNGARASGIAWAVIGLLCLGFTLARQAHVNHATLAISLFGSAWIFTHNGRPEPIAAVIVAATLLVLPLLRYRFQLGMMALSLGVIGAATPAAALLIAPWIVIFIAYHIDSPKTAFLSVITVATVSAAVALAFVSATGCSPSTWIHSMMLHSKNVVWGRNDGDFSRYWLLSPERPLLIVIAAVLAGCSWSSVSGLLQRQAWAQFVAAMSLACFLCLAYVVAIRPTPCIYNLFPLFVILTAVALRSGERKAGILIGCVMLIPMAGLARSACMWQAATTTGLSREAASAMLAEDLQKVKSPAGTIALTGGLFELTDVPHVAALHPKIVSWSEPASTDLFVVQQANMGSLNAPQMPNFSMVADHFDHHKPALAALGLAKTSGSYAYALYVRNGADGKTR